MSYKELEDVEKVKKRLNCHNTKNVSDNSALNFINEYKKLEKHINTDVLEFIFKMYMLGFIDGHSCASDFYTKMLQGP